MKTMKISKDKKEIYLCPKCGGELIPESDSLFYKCDGKKAMSIDSEGEWHCAFRISYFELINPMPTN